MQDELNCPNERIKRLEADCAVMRDVLEEISTMPYPEEDDDFTRIVGNCKQALSTTSGAELLARMKRYEAAFSKLYGFGKGDLTANELCGYINETIEEAMGRKPDDLLARLDHLQRAANDLCNAAASLANLAGGIPDGGLSQIATSIQTTQDAIKQVREAMK